MPNIYLPGVVTVPSSLVITSITSAFPMVVTVVVDSITEANTYIPGMLVRFTIPSTYGMQQLNGQTLQISAVNGLAFSFLVDSTQFDPFVVPPITQAQPASLAPAGSNNLQYDNNSAQVPFKSLNNIGN